MREVYLTCIRCFSEAYCLILLNSLVCLLLCMHFLLLLRFPPHAAVSHVAHHPLLPLGASCTSSLPTSSHVRHPSRAASGFLLHLKLLSPDLLTMFQLSKILCRTFHPTDQKWFRRSYQLSTTLDRLHFSRETLKHLDAIAGNWMYDPVS